MTPKKFGGCFLPRVKPALHALKIQPRESEEVSNFPHATYNMAKRQADGPLEDVLAIDSPASKKARVDDVPELHRHTNGSSHALGRSVPVEENEREEDERNGNDISATADRKQEEPEEAAGEPIDQDETSAYSVASRQQAPTEGYSDLYLDTINRSVLDFDFEKLCSITLSNINVYACLVCGKYYQGRGPKSHAYFHALEVGHHVYVNMQTKRVYVLPEGYEVKSKSLDDIKFVVDPKLAREEVTQLDREAKDAWDLGGKKYRPGTFISFWTFRKPGCWGAIAFSCPFQFTEDSLARSRAYRFQEISASSLHRSKEGSAVRSTYRLMRIFLTIYISGL